MRALSVILFLFIISSSMGQGINFFNQTPIKVSYTALNTKYYWCRPTGLIKVDDSIPVIFKNDTATNYIIFEANAKQCQFRWIQDIQRIHLLEYVDCANTDCLRLNLRPKSDRIYFDRPVTIGK